MKDETYEARVEMTEMFNRVYFFLHKEEIEKAVKERKENENA